jgi:uncharacterized damage-inducible protein DinB
VGTVTVVSTFAREFQKTRLLADRAIAQLSDDQLHIRLDDEANSVAVLMQHMAGNMRSRWTDFLTSDGEKPWRQRDAEFDPPLLTRAELLASWENGWGTLFGALDGLTDDDLARTVTIRGEAQAVLSALARQLVHYAGHAYQIVLLAKHLQGPAWTTLSIARGQSSAYTDVLRGSGKT